MKKITKILATILTAALLCGGAATMASCSRKNDDPAANEQVDYSQIKAYKVKVVDPDGKPVAGVRVQICKGEDCMQPIATGADGVAVLEYKGAAYPEAIYEIHLQNVPDGYTFDNTKYKTPATYGDIIEVKLDKAA